jgi:hypothetical protein
MSHVLQIHDENGCFHFTRVYRPVAYSRHRQYLLWLVARFHDRLGGCGCDITFYTYWCGGPMDLARTLPPDDRQTTLNRPRIREHASEILSKRPRKCHYSHACLSKSRLRLHAVRHMTLQHWMSTGSLLHCRSVGSVRDMYRKLGNGSPEVS